MSTCFRCWENKIQGEDMGDGGVIEGRSMLVLEFHSSEQEIPQVLKS